MSELKSAIRRRGKMQKEGGDSDNGGRHSFHGQNAELTECSRTVLSKLKLYNDSLPFSMVAKSYQLAK